MNASDALTELDRREAADERNVPQWWECDLPLEQWAKRYNAAHPMPELEIELRMRRYALAVRIARIDALLAQAERNAEATDKVAGGEA